MTDTLKIEAGKEYLLRNGWRMRCYATDGEADEPIHGAYFEGDAWRISEWMIGGWWNGDISPSPMDIISEAPKTIEVDCWLRIYDDGSQDIFDEPANAQLMLQPIAQIHIKRTVQHGEGM